MRKVNALSAVVAVLITAALSGVVASNASNPTIYACVSKAGALSKVSKKSHSCPKGTTKMSWGIAGIKGATGSQGAQGPYGPEGAAGAQGPVGEAGPAGLQGPVGEPGPAGSDGGGVTVYNGYDSGQTKSLIGWGAGPAGDYRVVTTANTVPAGNYFVTANSTFRYGGAEVYECWISMDVLGSYSNAGQIFINPSGPGPSNGSTALSLSGVVVVPPGGSKISLSCAGGTSTTNFESSIAALKIASLNPSN
jgi:hypothetical protein